jgi:hypothetical protein
MEKIEYGIADSEMLKMRTILKNMKTPDKSVINEYKFSSLSKEYI